MELRSECLLCQTFKYSTHDWFWFALLLMLGFEFCMHAHDTCVWKPHDTCVWKPEVNAWHVFLSGSTFFPLTLSLLDWPVIKPKELPLTSAFFVLGLQVCATTSSQLSLWDGGSWRSVWPQNSPCGCEWSWTLKPAPTSQKLKLQGPIFLFGGRGERREWVEWNRASVKLIMQPEFSLNW